MLRYTATGSELRNDIKITMQNFATERINRGGDRMEPIGVRMSVILDLAVSSGELKLTSTDINVQPQLNYNYFAEEFDRQRSREGMRTVLELAEHEDFKDVLAERIEPLDSDLESDDALDNWDDARGDDRPAYLRDLQDGAVGRSDGGRGPAWQGTWAGGSANCGRLDNAGLHSSEHQRHDDDDRGADSRVDRSGGIGGKTKVET